MIRGKKQFRRMEAGIEVKRVRIRLAYHGTKVRNSMLE